MLVKKYLATFLFLGASQVLVSGDVARLVVSAAKQGLESTQVDQPTATKTVEPLSEITNYIRCLHQFNKNYGLLSSECEHFPVGLTLE